MICCIKWNVCASLSLKRRNAIIIIARSMHIHVVLYGNLWLLKWTVFECCEALNPLSLLDSPKKKKKRKNCDSAALCLAITWKNDQAITCPSTCLPSYNIPQTVEYIIYDMALAIFQSSFNFINYHSDYNWPSYFRGEHLISAYLSIISNAHLFGSDQLLYIDFNWPRKNVFNAKKYRKKHTHTPHNRKFSGLSGFELSVWRTQTRCLSAQFDLWGKVFQIAPISHILIITTTTTAEKKRVDFHLKFVWFFFLHLFPIAVFPNEKRIKRNRGWVVWTIVNTSRMFR